jgi:hypothetical protein
MTGFDNIVSGLSSALVPSLDQYKAEAVQAATAVAVFGVVVVVELAVIIFILSRGGNRT